MRCPNCGEDNIFGALNCVKCGFKLTAPCPYCGKENVLGVWACQHCGKFIRNIKGERQESSEGQKAT